MPSYAVNDVAMYVLHDAVVHGEQGIISVGDMIVAESLFHVNLELQGFTQDKVDKQVYFLRNYIKPETWVESASHVLCGFVGNRNYAHWWVDVVPAIMIPPFHDAFKDTTLLMPQIRNQWQRDTLALLPETYGRTVFIGEHDRIGCRELCFVPKVTQSHPHPHPFRRRLLDAVKERAGFDGSHSGRRIYLSRRDASARKLLNEDDVSAMLTYYGFETVVMTGRSVAEQIKLFAEASHIISPHGAGLANVLFCQPDAALCEFLMPSYVNWSIRKMAAISEMRYGCILGREIINSDSPIMERNWMIDLDDLEKLVRDQNFMREPNVVG